MGEDSGVLGPIEITLPLEATPLFDRRSTRGRREIEGRA
jgi:hypothetical protein